MSDLQGAYYRTLGYLTHRALVIYAKRKLPSKRRAAGVAALGSGVAIALVIASAAVAREHRRPGTV